MRKLALALVGGLAGLAIVWAVATTLPLAALFWRIARISLAPSTVSWDTKAAWVKCDGAIAGTLAWPQAPAAACEAMHLCANEAPLLSDQQASLMAAMRRLPIAATCEGYSPWPSSEPARRDRRKNHWKIWKPTTR